MQIRELKVSNAYEVTPVQRRDERGVFLEWFRFDELERVSGRPLNVRQANTSVSARGVVRGIHFAEIPLGQAKFVTVMAGSVLDYVVDIRVGSPTFGEWDSVVLDAEARRSVFLAEGLGHAFVSLTDNAVVTYLVSDVYNPGREHSINPLDPVVGLVFPDEVGQPRISPKDADAPTLRELESNGLLPRWDETLAFYSSLRNGS